MSLKIGIVEDEPLISEILSRMLKTMGYTVTETATRYSEAIDLIERDKPDLLLLDIGLEGHLDGIDLAHIIHKRFDIPFIFLSASSDQRTIERAKEVRPSAFLAKPIREEQLYSCIEIAFNNFNAYSNYQNTNHEKDYVFVKDGATFRKIYFHQILFISSEANYVSLRLKDKSKILVRSTLAEFSEQLDKSVFFRVHRCHIVNVRAVDRVYQNDIHIRECKIPLSKNYKTELMSSLGISF